MFDLSFGGLDAQIANRAVWILFCFNAGEAE